MKKRKRYTAAQKDAAVHDFESGMPMADVCAKHHMSNPTIYTWRKKKSKQQLALVTKARRRAIATVTTLPVNANVDEVAIAMRDATIFLRKAKAELLRDIREGRLSDFDSTHLLAMLALRSLQGDNR